ncbi:MAG TPA: ABC transporter permease [Actinomycetaceae bacterium]|nr:ABC transporter permease [Actinomycetaceae bacterium]
MNAMTTLGIVRRNLTIFFRDRGQVFFAVLAPLILLMLYVLFLGRMQITSLEADMQDTPPEDIGAFIYSWVLAGMVLITTLSASLSAMGAFVTDRVAGRFKEFRVSPVRESELAVGYLVSSVVISLVLSLAVLLVGSVVLGLMYGAWSTPMGYLQAVLYTALLCFTFSALAALTVTFVRSEGAFSGLATMVGTLAGFAAFAYIPIGVVTDTVASVLNTLPFAQGAMLLRDPLSGPALETMLEPFPDSVRGETLEFFRGFYGYEAYIGDLELTPMLVVVILVVLTVVFTALAAWRIRRLTKLDMR